MNEKNIAELDANFRSREIGSRELEFHDGFESPFALEGFPFRDAGGRRSRLPLEAARLCDKPGILPMSMQGAGETVRFRTDSPAVGFRAGFSEIYRGNNRGGSNGFDLYTGVGAAAKFRGNRLIPEGGERIEGLFEGNLPRNGEMYDCAIHFPYHSAVTAFAVGVAPGARIEPPTPHRFARPVVFYGSSITNCSTAGRPGMVYPSLIARRMDFHLINMGFSGGCRGELCIADAIAELDIAALVMEFDHNAPDPAFLAERHEPFFRRYRARRPEVPVLMMSRCDFDGSDDAKLRREIIQRTWLNAVSNGDRRVDFLDGETLFAGPWREECTFDCCHPNDFGAVLMAERIIDRLERLLRQREERRVPEDTIRG